MECDLVPPAECCASGAGNEVKRDNTLLVDDLTSCRLSGKLGVKVKAVNPLVIKAAKLNAVVNGCHFAIPLAITVN